MAAWLAGIGFVLVGASAGHLIGDVLSRVAPALGRTGAFFWAKRSNRALWPDGIRMMAAGLDAGLSLSAALDLFERCLDGRRPVRNRLSFGKESDDDRIARLFGADDLRGVRVALLLAKTSGGRLAHSLRAAARALEANDELEREARAASAHGRGTAWIVGLTPLGFLLFGPLVSPETYGLLFTTPAGRMLVGASLGLTVLGLWMAMWLARADT